MAVPFPNILDILRPALPPILVIVALVLAICGISAWWNERPFSRSGAGFRSHIGSAVAV
jgi:hypothetical protein